MAAGPILTAIYGFFEAVGVFITQKWVQGVLFTATLAIGVKGYRESRQMLAKGQDILANKLLLVENCLLYMAIEE